MKVAIDKAERFEAVAIAVLHIIHLRGVDGVTHSLVARHAKVSRAWIYKYVARSREDLLAFGAGYLGQLLVGDSRTESRRDPERWKDRVCRRLSHLLELVERSPNAARLYFQYRGTAGVLGHYLEKVGQAARATERAELQVLLGIDELEAERRAEAIHLFRMSLAHGLAPTALPVASSQSILRAAPREWTLRCFERFLEGMLRS